MDHGIMKHPHFRTTPHRSVVPRRAVSVWLVMLLTLMPSLAFSMQIFVKTLTGKTITLFDTHNNVRATFSIP